MCLNASRPDHFLLFLVPLSPPSFYNIHKKYVFYLAYLIEMQSKKSGGVPSKKSTLPLKKPLQMLHLNKKYRSDPSKQLVVPKPVIRQPPRVSFVQESMDDLLDGFASMFLPKTKKSKTTKKARSTAKKPSNVLSQVVKQIKKDQKPKKTPKTEGNKMKLEPSRVSTRNKKKTDVLLY